MVKYYPDLSGNGEFIYFLKELDFKVRNNVKLVLDLYECIIKYNDYKRKIFIYYEVLVKNDLVGILNEFNEGRLEILNILKKLNVSDNYLNNYLDKIEKKNQKELIIKSTISHGENINNLKTEVEYLNIKKFITKIIILDINKKNNEDVENSFVISEVNNSSSKYILEIEDILIEAYCLYNFLFLNKVKGYKFKEN